MSEKNKELKEKYKQIKPKMGVMIIRNSKDNKCHIEAVENLTSAMNRAKFQLRLGSHPNKELQKAWNDMGESSFSIETLDYLDYDKDGTETDYKDELLTLQAIWTDKLSNESGAEFYGIKISQAKA